MDIDAAAVAGAGRILSQGLSLKRDDDVLILADETTIDVVDVFAEAAYEAGIRLTILLVPISMQRRIPNPLELSVVTEEAISQSRTILTCINGSPECMAFRTHILGQSLHLDKRFGHMPGATPEVLRLADVDFEELTHDCKRLEMALARGKSLSLISQTSTGQQHTLTVDIGGWTRLPIVSDGVIEEGMWGNTPSGETYIAPVEGTAEGSVVISGSIPDLVIQPGHELILHFLRGNLDRIEPEQSAEARFLRETQIERARAQGDTQWSNLAEIGIGVNRAVNRLTGNMLYDEKAVGTAHVALGRNIHMGGAVASAIHCDMALRSPTILVDGKSIVANGQITVRDEDWRLNYRRVELPPNLNDSALQFKAVGNETRADPEGRLLRLLKPATGRNSDCFVGDDETAKLAARVLPLLQSDVWLPLSDLAQAATLDLATAYRMADVLEWYGLVSRRLPEGE